MEEVSKRAPVCGFSLLAFLARWKIISKKVFLPHFATLLRSVFAHSSDIPPYPEMRFAAFRYTDELFDLTRY